MRRPILTLSIVSHGQGNLIRHLLQDIRQRIAGPYEVIVTINVPEPEGFLTGFADMPLHILRNRVARGFGSNHNAAFALSRGDYFAVLNPDVRLVTFELAPLIAQADDPRVGACAPLVRSDAGAVEDSARRLLTAGRMIGRLLGWVPRLDYEITGRPIDVDWLAGIFILFRRDAFAAIQGFDERYFMYCEDADLCARLRMSGYSVRLVPGSVIVHRAQRASHRRLRYSYWHIRSLIRFLFGQYRSRLHSPAAVVRLR